MQAPAEPALKNQQAAEKLFEEAAQHGFDMRGTVENRWARDLKTNAGLRAGYAEVKPCPQADRTTRMKELSLEWAKEMYATVMHGKPKVEKWKKINVMKGTHCTFEILTSLAITPPS